MRLIDADALKKAITEHCRSEMECLNHFWYDENIIALLDNAPTVEAVSLEHHNKIKGILDNEIKSLVDILDKERPQGKWGKWVISEIRCPNCLEYFLTDCYSKEELKKCPNCGAKMTTGDEEAETCQKKKSRRPPRSARN